MGIGTLFFYLLFFSLSFLSFHRNWKYVANNFKLTVEEMKEVIDVESYEIDTQSIIHEIIDVVLHSNGLFRLDAFSYIVGDYLFDTL